MKPLRAMSSRFESYVLLRFGRPSIAPEKLLRALLLQVFFSVRSERMLMDQLNYNLLFRWFVGLNMDEPVWDATVFSKNRDPVLHSGPARENIHALESLKGYIVSGTGELKRTDGYLSDSGNPYILWLRDWGIAEHLTRDLYGTGSTATAC